MGKRVRFGWLTRVLDLISGVRRTYVLDLANEFLLTRMLDLAGEFLLTRMLDLAGGFWWTHVLDLAVGHFALGCPGTGRPSLSLVEVLSPWLSC